MKKRIGSIDEFRESINEAKQPKWWNSDFTMQVIAAYKNKEFDINDPKSVEEWDKKYNGGTVPKPAFNTAELVRYALSIGKTPDGKKLDESSINNKSDNAFLQKVISSLEKSGFAVTYEHTKGILTVTGDDDEKLKFEYFY